jgi:mono/diheme cytochrome c family protein
MHAVISKPVLNEPQVWADVAAYLGKLPMLRRPERGSGRKVELEQGAAIYTQRCIECHAADALGDDDGFVPALRSQHYTYLVTQLRSLAAAHPRNVDPEFMGFIDTLQPRYIEAVADYLSRLSGPVSDRTKLRDDGTLRN